MATVSVVIRTYTEARWEGFVACVRSVQAQTRPPEEVVLVVDHNPSLYERVLTAFPGARVVENRGPQGSSGAWNAGVGAASGDILAFIDDDATAEPTWLAELARGYRDPRTVGVGGAILPRWLGKRPGWFPEEFAWVVGCTYRGLPAGEAPVRNLIGCNMSFRREAFALVGGFLGAEGGIGHLGATPVGGDETEFCIRLGLARPDLVLLYRPSARVHHLVPPKRASFAYFLSRNLLEGRSKARIARLVGGQDRLDSERRHALRTLPLGMLGAMGDFLRLRDRGGLGRALAMALGLAWAAGGYLGESLSLLLARRLESPGRPGPAEGRQVP